MSDRQAFAMRGQWHSFRLVDDHVPRRATGDYWP
jgi:hypothetical protein